MEIGATTVALERGLRATERRLRAFGSTMQGFGQRFAMLGVAAAAPLAASVRAFSSYEDALASLRAAANPTAEELQQVEAAVGEISKATGRGPAEVVAAMTALLKAGLGLDVVLGGAAEAAIKFARVAETDVTTAAETMTDAMNVFGVTTTRAMDTMSRAADASSISIEQVIQSFSQFSAVSDLAGQSIEDTANAIAILGQNGVKGSDAGTSLKTMLLRLQTGAETAGEVMRALNINVRDGAGNMLDMRGIIGTLQKRLEGLSKPARDLALYKLFGTDAIRAGAILVGEGVEGWDEFNAKMAEGLPVADKFATLMDTLSGSASMAWAAIQRLGVAVGVTLGDGLGGAAAAFATMIDRLTEWVSLNRGLIVGAAKVAAGLVAAGAALIGIGLAAKVAAGAFGLLATTVGFLASPLGIAIGLLAVAGAAFVRFSETGRAAIEGVMASATRAFEGISNALKGGDIGLAAKILWLSLRVEFQKGFNFLNGLWQDWGVAARTAISDVQYAFARFVTNLGIMFEKRLNEISALFSKTWAFIRREFFTGEDIGDELARIDARLARRNRIASKIGRGEVNRLRDEQAAADEARFAGARDSLASGDAELARLEAELAAALAAAAEAAKPKVAEAIGDAVGGEGKGRSGTSPVIPALDDVIAESGRKVDVAGSFSAAALRGLEAGSSIENDQLDEQKKTNDLLGRIDNRARQGRLVFTG